ncbi:MAG TPA: hypothetical protein VHM25_17750 [Polyangiaceae bacterium]|nr:hypothetical protein [Polyangiaceae bacterium]
MTELEVALLEAVQCAIRARDLRSKLRRAGPLTAKELRRKVISEERWFNQLSIRALAKVDEALTKGKPS